MTLIIALHGVESIWMLADRRLSRVGLPPRDDARKLMILETKDGVALLGYSGLGATAAGTEPADWMNAVLRGLNIPLEGALNVLAGALQRQLPRHLKTFDRSIAASHTVVAIALLNSEARLYTIDLTLTADRQAVFHRFSRHVLPQVDDRPPLTPRLCLSGSGSAFLRRNPRRLRQLLSLVKASDEGRISPRGVADYLATLGYATHKSPVTSVGPTAVVVWRNRRSGRHSEGGGHQFYDAGARVDDDGGLPTMSRGRDLQAFAGAILPFMLTELNALREGRPSPGIDKVAIDAEVAKLPNEPDEHLR